MCNERAKVFSATVAGDELKNIYRKFTSSDSFTWTRLQAQEQRYPVLPQNAAADILTALIIRLSSFPQKAPPEVHLIRF